MLVPNRPSVRDPYPCPLALGPLRSAARCSTSRYSANRASPPGSPRKLSADAMRALLDGGYLCVIRLSDGVHGYVDDEGLLKELPLNFLLRGEPIVGPAIFSKADAEGDEIGFETEEEASRVCARINQEFHSGSR